MAALLCLTRSTSHSHSLQEEREQLPHSSAHLLPAALNLSDDKNKLLDRPRDHLIKSIQAGTSGQQASSEAKLVEEHFIKAGLSTQVASSKPEQAAYSLYGYQSQPYPHKYVSKDQLQQQLCKDEKTDKSSPKLLLGKDSNKRISQGVPPRTATGSVEPANTHASFSNQLIQEGLIPNPAYASHSSVASNVSNNASNSMSALVNMSKHAGSHIADRFVKDKSPTVKSEPVSISKNNQSSLPTSATPSLKTQPPLYRSFRAFVENTVTKAFFKSDEEQKKVSPTRSPPPAATVKSEKLSNGTIDTDSDTLSAPSPTLSIKTEGADSKPCHPKMKLKKEWLQRHAEGGVICPTSSSSPTSAASGTLLNSSTTSNMSETTTSASETESEQQVGSCDRVYIASCGNKDITVALVFVYLVL